MNNKLKEDWKINYYNFLVNNGMTKHTADQAVDFVEAKLKDKEDNLIKIIEGMKQKMHSVGGGDIGGYIDVPDDAYNRSVESHNKILDDILTKIKNK